MNTFLATTTLPVPLMQTNPSFLQCKREATFSRTIFHTVYLALLRSTTAILNYTKQLIKVQCKVGSLLKALTRPFVNPKNDLRTALRPLMEGSSFKGLRLKCLLN